MKEILVEANLLPEAYHKALAALHTKGDVVTCNDWDQNQKEVSLTMLVQNPLAEPMISKLFIGGFRELQQYVMEVLDGILDFKIGEDTCWEYTYHDRMVNFPVTGGGKGVNQIEFVVNELKRNSDSRRAVINIRDNSIDPFNENPACLQHMQFFVRGGKLHCKVLMRSNDATKATFMNAFAFIMLQKKIADALGVPVGTYTHRANSFHCYEKDFGLLQQYIDGINKGGLDDVTYEFEGMFKDMMEEAVPEIEELVREIRNG